MGAAQDNHNAIRHYYHLNHPDRAAVSVSQQRRLNQYANHQLTQVFSNYDLKNTCRPIWRLAHIQINMIGNKI